MGTRGFLIVFLIAFGATAPNAHAAYLTAEPLPLSLSATSTSEHVFTFEAELNAKCKKASFTGTLSEPTNDISLTPSFTECTAFGSAATVTTTGCQFVLHPDPEDETSPFSTTLDLSCEAGKALTIATATCEVKISGQTGLSSAETSNNGESPSGVGVVLGIKEASYNKTKDEGGCLLNGTGVKADGGLTGNSTLIGESEEEQIQIQLITWSVLCKDNLGKECAAGQEIKPPKSFTGTATNFKLITVYNDGLVVKNVTVTCKKATLTATAKKYTLLTGQLETPLETWSTETCTEDNAQECTVQVREVPTGGSLKAGANGNGTWKTTVKVKVICGAVPLICHYGKQFEFTFEGNAMAAELKATNVDLDLEKPGSEEKNCGNNPAKMTSTYALNLGAFLRKG